MLNASATFKTMLASNNRKLVTKVTITRNDSGATPIDITDRVMSYNYTHDFESRNGRLNLELDNYDYLLSPLNRNSVLNQKSGVYDPLLDANHKVEIFEGFDIGNNTTELIKKFEGYLGDELGASSQPTIQLSCRDKSKLMQDTYIYEGPSYSLYLVEDVIQDLIDMFVPDLGITVSVLTPTQYMIGRPDGPYAPQDVNLWDACQTLADSANQELRFTEDGSLIMRLIDRDFSSKPVNMTLDMSTLIDDSMQISDADVRNHIVVKVQGYDPITAIDEDSVAKYGRRYMEVQRSMSDIITDVTQAHELADGILRDLRYANPTETSEIPFHPLVQVGDIVQITNPRLGTNPTDDIFKVISVNNMYAPDRKRTSLTLKGYDKFLATPSIAPKPATTLASQIQTRKIQNYPNSGWVGYEKTTSFPMLTWVAPTQDVSGNALQTNFGGYIIERGTLLNASGNAITATWRWGSIASIPSYIGALGKKVDYFYDYSSGLEIDKIKKAGGTGSSATLKYRITAINKRGVKSTKTTELSVSVPFPVIKDASGKVI